jgi:hypothetical protein
MFSTKDDDAASGLSTKAPPAGADEALKARAAPGSRRQPRPARCGWQAKGRTALRPAWSIEQPLALEGKLLSYADEDASHCRLIDRHRRMEEGHTRIVCFPNTARCWPFHPFEANGVYAGLRLQDVAHAPVQHSREGWGSLALQARARAQAASLARVSEMPRCSSCRRCYACHPGKGRPGTLWAPRAPSVHDSGTCMGVGSD